MTWLEESVREFATKEDAEKAWGAPLRWRLEHARHHGPVLARHGPRWLGGSVLVTVAIVPQKEKA